jgi:hypothetical protein
MTVGQSLNSFNMFNKFGMRKSGERPEISQTYSVNTSAVEGKDGQERATTTRIMKRVLNMRNQTFGSSG